MPSHKSIAMRKQAAIDRIVAALGVDDDVPGRRAEMAEVLLLERIADSMENTKPDLAGIIANASIRELAAMPGIGEATARRIKQAAAEKTT